MKKMTTKNGGKWKRSYKNARGEGEAAEVR
jgi:hypothetical protein